MINPLNRTRKALALAVATFALTALLAACSGTVGTGTLRVTLSPTSEIGYDMASGVVTARNFVMHNAPGAHPVTITGYETRYFDENDNPLAGGAGAETALSIYVPAGIRCDAPDPEFGCTLRDAGAYYAPGYTATFGVTSNQLMPVEVIGAWETAGFPHGWYAEVVFTGRNNLNSTFTTTPYRFDMVPPN